MKPCSFGPLPVVITLFATSPALAQDAAPPPPPGATAPLPAAADPPPVDPVAAEPDAAAAAAPPEPPPTTTTTPTVAADAEVTEAPPAADKPAPSPHEVHAYARGGLAVNGEGGYQQTFVLDGADRYYRLGNKDDFYLEISYDYHWIADDTIELGTRLMVSYYGHNIGSDPFDGDAIHFREGYAWLSRIVRSMPELRVWAGQRYYGREYIPQLDLFYSSAEGVGGGVENIDVGIGKLAVGYLGATKKVIQARGMEVQEYDRGRMVKSSLDMRLTDIALPHGELKAWANVAFVPGGRIEEVDMEFDDMWGVLAGAQWTAPLGSLNGDNNLGVVFKRGLNNFREFPDSAFVNNGNGGPGDFTNLDTYEPDSYRLMVADWLAIQPSPRISVLGTALVRMLDPGTDDGMSYWLSAGVQPMYYYGKRLGVGFETSIDYVIDDATDDSGHLTKLTLVHKVLASPHWWANPSVQAFVTYASWDRDVGLAYSWSSNGYGVNYQPVDAQETQGLSIGAMFETYF